MQELLKLIPQLFRGISFRITVITFLGLAVRIGLLAQTVTLANLSTPKTSIEVGNTVQVTITGGVPHGTVTVDQTKDGVWGGGPLVVGSADASGTFVITATEGPGDVGTYRQIWAIAGVAANPNPLSFQVFANFVGQRCPGPSTIGMGRYWIWSPVGYAFSSVLPAAAITGAASSWNSAQSKISLGNFGSLATADVAIWDNNGLPSNIGAQVTTYDQRYGTCLTKRDTCGHCMTNDTMYAADMELNANLLITVANNENFNLTDWTKLIVAHEFGHVLRLGDVPVINGICSEVQSVMYQVGNTMFRCGFRTPTSCDANGINQVYPSSVGAWCPCSGTSC
jgi:hypothetical protein